MPELPDLYPAPLFTTEVKDEPLSPLPSPSTPISVVEPKPTTAPTSPTVTPTGEIDIVAEWTPQQLADFSIKTKGEFDPQTWAKNNLPRLADPGTEAKIADAHALLASRGVKGFWEDLDTKKAAVNLIKTVPSMVKWTGRALSLVGPALGEATAATINSLGGNVDTLQEEDVSKKSAELFASTELGVTGLSTLAKKTGRGLGRAVGLLKNPIDMTPKERLDLLWGAVGEASYADKVAEGHGAITSALLGGPIADLEKQGVKVDPAVVGELSAGDPVTFLAFPGGFKVLTASGKVIAKVASKAMAVDLVTQLRTAQRAATAAVKAEGTAIENLGAVKAARSVPGVPTTITEPALTQAGQEATAASQAAAGALAEQETAAQAVANSTRAQLALKTAEAARNVVQPISKAAAKVAEKAGEISDRGVEIALGLAPAVTGIGLRASAAVGEFAASFIPPLATPKIFRRGYELAGKGGAQQTTVAKQLLTGATESYSPLLRLTTDIAKGAPDVAAGAAKGYLLFDVPLAAVTSETPKDTAEMPVFGSFFGALGSAPRVGRRIVQGQAIAPRAWGNKAPIRDYGSFPALDAGNKFALENINDPAVTQRLSALRDFLKPAKAEMYLLDGTNPDPATGRTQFEDAIRRYRPGLTDEEYNQQGQQMGITFSPRAADGTTRKVILVRELSAAPHEAFHPFQDVLGEPAMKKIRDLVYTEYVPIWELIGKHYAEQFLSPKEFAEQYQSKGLTWHDAIVDINKGAEWRKTASRQEIDNTADEYINNELSAEIGDAVLKHTGPELLQNQSFPGKLARILGKTMVGLGVEPFQGVRTEGQGIPLRIETTEGVREALRGGIEALKVENRRPDILGMPEATPRSKRPSPVTPRTESTATPATPVTPTTAEAEAVVAEDLAKTLPPKPPVIPGGRTSQEILTDVAAAIRSRGGLLVDYRHAPGEPAAAPAVGREARRAIIEFHRTAPEDVRSLFAQLFFPDRAVKTGKGIQIMGWSPEVFASNAQKLAKTLGETGNTALVPYEIKDGAFTPDAWRELYSDLGVFVQNQMGGATGAGERLVVPSSVTAEGFFAPPESGTSTSLSQDRADVISALFGIKLPGSTRIGTVFPRNVAGQRVAEATKPGRTSIPVEPRAPFSGKAAEEMGVAGEQIKEVNPFRQQLAEAGVKPEFIEAIQRLNLDRVAEVSPAPEGTQEFRAKEFTLQAGFQPKPGKFEESLQKLKDLTSDEIREGNARGLGITERAYELARQVTDPSQLEDLKTAREEIETQIDELKPQMSVGGKFDMAVADQVMELATRGQMFREAYEAATNTGSAVGVLKREAKFAPSKDRRAVKEAATRGTRSGRIYTGTHHGETHDAIIAAEGEAVSDRVLYEDGFVTNSGEFLTRSQALKRAESLNQISTEDAETMREQWGGAEAIDFDQMRVDQPKEFDEFGRRTGNQDTGGNVQFSPAKKGYEGETIRDAAVEFDDGKTFFGPIHAVAYFAAEDHYGTRNMPAIARDAFRTSRNRIVSRDEGLTIAEKAGQVPRGETFLAAEDVTDAGRSVFPSPREGAQFSPSKKKTRDELGGRKGYTATEYWAGPGGVHEAKYGHEQWVVDKFGGKHSKGLSDNENLRFDNYVKAEAKGYARVYLSPLSGINIESTPRVTRWTDLPKETRQQLETMAFDRNKPLSFDSKEIFPQPRPGEASFLPGPANIEAATAIDLALMKEDTEAPRFTAARIAGGTVATPRASYREASKDTNPWIRRSADPAKSNAPTNEGRQLLVQFSSDLITGSAAAQDKVSSEYYDKLYSGARPGYARLEDFWEIPQWMGYASHIFPDADVFVVRDIASAREFLRTAGYDRVLMSALDVNKKLVSDLIEGYKGKVDIGGYVRPEEVVKGENVKWHDSFESLAKDAGIEYSKGVDYRHFKGSDVIPRLTMSTGCKHKCAFCAVTKDLVPATTEEVTQQVDAIAELGAKLVYLNDKTFGQAANYTELADQYARMKEKVPDFKGFVVQTTAAQMQKLSAEWLKKSGIKFIELGIESYNDPILREMRKPATESLMDKATDRLREAQIALIPNIIVGFPSETATTYARTLEWLQKNSDIISHANIYNLALYENTELGKKMTTASEADFNENVLEKSFHTDPEIHRVFAGDLYGYASELLQNTPASAKFQTQRAVPEGMQHVNDLDVLWSGAAFAPRDRKKQPEPLGRIPTLGAVAADAANRAAFEPQSEKRRRQPRILGQTTTLGAVAGNVAARNRFTDESFKTSVDAIREGRADGGTFTAEGKTWEPPTEPVDIVSLASVNVPRTELTPERVQEAVSPFSALLDHPNVVAGVFAFDRSPNATASIDVNAVVPQEHRKNTLAFAKDNDQISIWDASKFEEVKAGGTGDTVLKSVKQIESILDDLTSGRSVDVPAAAKFAPRKRETDYSKYNEPSEEKVPGTVWVLPDGKLHPLEGIFHESDLDKNSATYDRQFGTNFKGVDVDQARLMAVNAGFVRVRYDPKDGSMRIESNVDKWDGQKKVILDHALNHAEDIDRLYIGLMDANGDQVGAVSRNVFQAKDKEQAIRDVFAEVKPVASTRTRKEPGLIEQARALPGSFQTKRQSEEALSLPGLDISKPLLSNAARAQMSLADLRKMFPEAAIPRTLGEAVPSDITDSPLYRRAGSEAEAVNAFAKRLVDFAREYADNPNYKAGLKWYSDLTPQLKKEFGKDADLFAELLAATSPNTNPEVNFAYAFDALESLRAGRFKKIIPKFEEGLDKIADQSWEAYYNRDLNADKVTAPPATPTPATFLAHWIDKFDLKPKQSNGKLYGQHSLPVLQVLARRWMELNAGPKTRNFVENLLGKSNEATVDVWADRTMRWAGYEGFQDRWRILPENQTGVSDKDFTFSQKAFRKAAEELKVKPSALQGALWFAEKQRWADNGWGRLNLGNFQTEMEKLPLLKSGFRQRVKTTEAVKKIKPRTQTEMELVQPRYENQ